MKKALSLCLVLVLLAAMAAGCAPSANVQSSSTPASSGGDASQAPATSEGGESQPAEPASDWDGTINIAFSTLGSTLDPVDLTDAVSAPFLYATYDRLVKYKVVEGEDHPKTDPATLEGSIAKSWDVSEDQLTWTFHLDENARFANGDPVTAEDVEYSISYVGSKPNGAFTYGLSKIESMNVIDDLTIEIKLSGFNPIFLQVLELYTFSIINKSEVEGQPADYLTSNTAGSGPYKITAYDVATEVVLEARDDYWGERAANDKVIVQLQKEVSTRQMLVENGDVDLTIELLTKDLPTLDAKDNLKVMSDGSNSIVYLAMNNAVEPFNDVNLRKAVCHAMPYDSLVTDIMYDNATRLMSYIPSIMPSHIENENTHYEQDLDKAKEYLELAGKPDGFTFDLVVGSGFQDWRDSAVLIQAELGKVGITMNIVDMERAAFLEAAAQLEMPAFITRFNSFVNDPGYLSGFQLAAAGEYNYYNYNNPEFERLYATAQDTADQAERYGYFEQMQEIVAADAPWAYMYEYNNSVVMAENLQGYTYYTDRTVRLETLHKS